MSETTQALDVARLAIASLILPLILLVSVLMFVNGLWKIGLASLTLSALFSILLWSNLKRVLRDDPVDDERMRKINTHAAASSFWTVFNLGMISFIAHMMFGLDAASLPGTREQIVSAAPGLSVGTLFFLYIGFRAYYIKFGIDSKFWRLN